MNKITYALVLSIFVSNPTIAATISSLYGDIDGGISTTGGFGITDKVINGDQSWNHFIDLDGGTIESASLTIGYAAAEVIPEPSTFLIWSLGLLGLAWYGRRRRTK